VAQSSSSRPRWQVRGAARAAVNTMAGWAVTLLIRLVRSCGRPRITDFAGGFMRRLGPWLPEHRVGRANLEAAFPEKSPAEIEAILRGAWDNLGRVGVEIALLDDICQGEGYTRPNLDFTPDDLARLVRIKEDGKPALIFAAHLANWELPAVIASVTGVPSAVLYRRPNLSAVDDAVMTLRARTMGELLPTNIGAPIGLMHALERGLHVGMLIDQHFGKGVEVTFFGRKCRANPLIAMLARKIDCPIHGTRAIRRPNDYRFTVELTEAVPPVRDAAGDVDIAATMQKLTSIVEGWVRQHPEQWLWLHRRWR
jgi:Kdo2-lipid IVA lauroyltransferase/acyltransferase